IELFKGFDLDTSIRNYLETTPIFKEKIKLLSGDVKEKLHIEIKDVWRPYYKNEYLLFPSKTWVINCSKY
ncbi:MAG: hypothetical protein HOE34_03875, partial [Pelagibacterales bacterium]|nr:hypothetical protein [Pelagibacterales bacterium]